MAIRVILITDPHKLSTRDQVMKILDHIDGVNADKNVISLACVDFPATKPEHPYDASMTRVSCHTPFVTDNKDIYIGVFGDIAKRHEQVAQGVGSKYSQLGCEVKYKDDFALIKLLQPNIEAFDQEFKTSVERAHKSFEGNKTRH